MLEKNCRTCEYGDIECQMQCRRIMCPFDDEDCVHFSDDDYCDLLYPQQKDSCEYVKMVLALFAPD